MQLFAAKFTWSIALQTVTDPTVQLKFHFMSPAPPFEEISVFVTMQLMYDVGLRKESLPWARCNFMYL